ncbi:MAG: hypothetical protein FWB72_00105 [Firmicutes bacterium]|nr:hypothetical protein [Bacillota bacterium]
MTQNKGLVLPTGGIQTNENEIQYIEGGALATGLIIAGGLAIGSLGMLAGEGLYRLLGGRAGTPVATPPGFDMGNFRLLEREQPGEVRRRFSPEGDRALQELIDAGWLRGDNNSIIHGDIFYNGYNG